MYYAKIYVFIASISIIRFVASAFLIVNILETTPARKSKVIEATRSSK